MYITLPVPPTSHGLLTLHKEAQKPSDEIKYAVYFFLNVLPTIAYSFFILLVYLSVMNHKNPEATINQKYRQENMHFDAEISSM